MNELILIEDKNLVAIFQNGGLDPLIDKIEKQARSILVDISTVQGRKDVASLAHKIAKTKTAIDSKGKELVSEWKSKSKIVDAERKKTRERLDALKSEIRQPLTDFENKETQRIESLENGIDSISTSVIFDEFDTDTQEIKDRIRVVKKIFENTNWQEFKDRAEEEYFKSLDILVKMVKSVQKAEEEAAELVKLREQAEAQRIKDLQEKAAKQATINAENKAKKKAVADKNASDLRAKENMERMEQEKTDAILAERAAIKEEEEAEIQARKKRESDKAHKAKINNEILDGLLVAGTDKALGKSIIAAIARGKIKNLTINY